MVRAFGGQHSQGHTGRGRLRFRNSVRNLWGVHQEKKIGISAKMSGFMNKDGRISSRIRVSTEKIAGQARHLESFTCKTLGLKRSNHRHICIWHRIGGMYQVTCRTCDRGNHQRKYGGICHRPQEWSGIELTNILASIAEGIKLVLQKKWGK